MTLLAIAALGAALVATGVLVATRRQMRSFVDGLRAGHDRDTAYRLLGDIPSSVEQFRSQSRIQMSAIALQRDLLMEILRGLGEGLLAIDRQHHVILANPRFAEMFGTGDNLVGHPLSQVVRIPALFNGFDGALAGREALERFPFRTGITERRIEMRVFPLSSDDIAAVALFLDVTQVERLEQIRRNFISDFSHEVRTPLTSLRSAVDSFEIAPDFMTAEEDQQLRRIMTRQLLRMERLVDDLSELSQIESGDIPLEKSCVNLHAIVTDLCEDFADRAAQKAMRFEIRGKAVKINADAMRMQQAFANLIDNAIKYGGENNEIEITVSESSDYAVVRISDHGEGIAAEEHTRIFRRFHRVDRSRSQEIGGSGLGLAITKHLILLHRGSIDVISAPGEGATFVVRLPRAPGVNV